MVPCRIINGAPVPSRSFTTVSPTEGALVHKSSISSIVVEDLGEVHVDMIIEVLMVDYGTH